MLSTSQKKNNYPINEAATIDTREKELRILKTIANPVINAAKAKFGKIYNVSKYVKVYNIDPDNEDLFIDGSSAFGIINLNSPAEFVEEYNFKTWKEYNEFFGFIMDEVEKKVSEKKLTGSVSSDLEKDGGWIYYSSKL